VRLYRLSLLRQALPLRHLPYGHHEIGIRVIGVNAHAIQVLGLIAYIVNNISMDNIIKSASKIVLITSSIALSIAFLYVALMGRVEGTVIADIFKFFLGAVAGFYFANKGEPNAEYLGK